MQNKKMVEKTLLSGMAKVTKKTSEMIANLPCIWWDYQPKMPKSVKKMRKF